MFSAMTEKRAVSLTTTIIVTMVIVKEALHYNHSGTLEALSNGAGGGNGGGNILFPRGWGRWGKSNFK